MHYRDVLRDINYYMNANNYLHSVIDYLTLTNNYGHKFYQKKIPSHINETHFASSITMKSVDNKLKLQCLSAQNANYSFPTVVKFIK